MSSTQTVTQTSAAEQVKTSAAEQVKDVDLRVTTGDDAHNPITQSSDKKVQSSARKFDMKKPPTFQSKEEELVYCKERLALAFRIFAQLGYEIQVAGHLTYRDPFGRGFWVNPFGMAFSQITVADLLLISEEGQVIEGGRKNRSYNAAGFAIHHALHNARPDVVAACHSHSTYGKAFAALGKEIEMISQDSCLFYNDCALYDSFGGVVLADEEGQNIAKAIGQKKAVILQNHGILTVGGSIDSAVAAFIMLEDACKVQLLADAAAAGRGRETVKIGEAEAEFTHKATGHDAALWFMAAPYFDRIEEATAGAHKN